MEGFPITIKMPVTDLWYKAHVKDIRSLPSHRVPSVQ